jgi:hypothetical protein
VPKIGGMAEGELPAIAAEDVPRLAEQGGVERHDDDVQEVRGDHEGQHREGEDEAEEGSWRIGSNLVPEQALSAGTSGRG